MIDGAGDPTPYRIPGAEVIRLLCDRKVFLDRVTCNSIFAIVVDKPDGWKFSHQKGLWLLMCLLQFGECISIIYQILSDPLRPMVGWGRGYPEEFCGRAASHVDLSGKISSKNAKPPCQFISGTLTSTQNGSKNGGWVRGNAPDTFNSVLKGWNI